MGIEVKIGNNTNPELTNQYVDPPTPPESVVRKLHQDYEQEELNK